MAKAFEGIKVVDFSQVLSGPFATQQLALLGADIIKIEPPGKGESGRHIKQAGDPLPKNSSAVFLSANAGKRSMTLDLKHPKAKEVVQRLVVDADVVIQNFKVGTIEKLGFSYEMLQAVNPKIIYCSISGYGQEGPKAGATAYDPVVQASSGVMQVGGTTETEPLRVGYPVIDMSTGLMAAFAISGALYRRIQTGHGQFLDVSMLDTAMSLLSYSYMMYLTSGEEPERLGNLSSLKIPTANVFKTADGPIQVTALTEAQIQKLCVVLGVETLLEDPRFSTVEQRVVNREAMHQLLTEAFQTRSALEWETIFIKNKIPGAAVLTFAQALQQPQLQYRDFLMKFSPPEGFHQEITSFNLPFDASEDGPGTELPPPKIGEHTDQVLEEFGFSSQEIQDLREAGVI